MKIKDVAVYEHWKGNNQDFYGAGIFVFAEKWADLMESRLDNGEKLIDIAESCSHEADTDGITGFMYGAAVGILAKCWEHGEELRKWHNKEYEYEGSGVVNPAILTISKEEA